MIRIRGTTRVNALFKTANVFFFFFSSFSSAFTVDGNELYTENVEHDYGPDFNANKTRSDGRNRINKTDFSKAKVFCFGIFS